MDKSSLIAVALGATALGGWALAGVLHSKQRQLANRELFLQITDMPMTICADVSTVEEQLHEAEMREAKAKLAYDALREERDAVQAQLQQAQAAIEKLDTANEGWLFDAANLSVANLLNVLDFGGSVSSPVATVTFDVGQWGSSEQVRRSDGSRSQSSLGRRVARSSQSCSRSTQKTSGSYFFLFWLQEVRFACRNELGQVLQQQFMSDMLIVVQGCDFKSQPSSPASKLVLEFIDCVFQAWNAADVCTFARAGPDPT